jgi:hypothetical protein
MNLNENPRLESIEVSDDPELAAFLLRVVDEIFSEEAAGDFRTKSRPELAGMDAVLPLSRVEMSQPVEVGAVPPFEARMDRVSVGRKAVPTTRTIPIRVAALAGVARGVVVHGVAVADAIAVESFKVVAVEVGAVGVVRSAHRRLPRDRRARGQVSRVRDRLTRDNLFLPPGSDLVNGG